MARTLEAFLLVLLAVVFTVHCEDIEALQRELAELEGEEYRDGPGEEYDPGDEDPKTIIGEYDVDKDGKISLQEIDDFPVHPQLGTMNDQLDLEVIHKAFTAGDTDGDHHLSINEIPAFLQALSEGRGFGREWGRWSSRGKDGEEEL